jgi:DNA-binding transcriptional regulator YhcF (GntR family)
MQGIFEIDANRRTPKYMQIVNSVTKAIKQGKYRKGDKIFSINELSNECFLSRDTVQKAYDLLEKERIIEAVRGKGFYINRTDIVVPWRVLLVFNKISNYKKMIYDAFVQTMGNKATVNLKIHHGNSRIFEDIIHSDLGEYDYYVIMPHFNEQLHKAREVMQQIPPEQLVIIDKDLPFNSGIEYRAVYQDFEHDIMDALESGLETLRKYKKLIYVQSNTSSHRAEIMNGFCNFCRQYNFAYQVVRYMGPDEQVHPGEAYIVIEDTDLVNLIKSCAAKKLKVGKQVGIISYNESPLKEILLDGISVISTDHYKMGESAARLILEQKKEKIKNPFSLTMRRSL